MPLDQGLMLGRRDALDADVALAADHEFDYVELNMETGFAREQLDPGRVAAVTDNHGLDVVVHLPYHIDPCSPHEHARDGACRELEAALDAAADAGAHRAVMHAETFADHAAWATDRMREQIVSVADRLATYGRDRGVDVAVENLKGDYYDVHSYAELGTRSAASLCLDTGHAVVSGMDAADQAAWFREHASTVSHLHLNDTRRDDDDEHLPVGLGTIDFEAIAAAILDTDWTGTATHEVWAPSGPGPVATAGKPVFDSVLAAVADDTCQNGNTL